MNIRKIIMGAGLGLLFIQPHAASGQGRAAWLDSVERNNVTLAAMRRQLIADKAAQAVDLRLPDPEVDMAYYQGSPDGVPARKNIDVTQTLDWGTLTGRRRQAVSEAQMRLERDYLVQRQALLATADEAYVEMAYANALCRELRRRATQSEELLQLVEKQNGKGGISLPELNKVRLNAAVVAAELRRAESDQAKAQAELVRLNGGRPVCVTDTAWLAPPLPPLATLLQQIATSPQVAAADATVAERRADVALQKTLAIPALAVGFTGEYVKGQNYSGLSLGFTLPIWGGAKQRKRQSREALASAQLAREDVTMSAHLTAEQRYAEALRLQKTVNDLRTQIERTDNAALLSRSLALGQISLRDYLLEITFSNEARKQLLDTERDAWLAQAAVWALLSQ